MPEKPANRAGRQGGVSSAATGFIMLVLVSALALLSLEVPALWGAEATQASGLEMEYPAPTVTSITPDTATNAGRVRIADLTGTGFYETPSVTLTGPSASVRAGSGTITARNVTVISAERITCTLNLEGVQPGSYSLTVTNPDSQSATMENAFTVIREKFPEWYLAEGSSDWGFETYVTIENPGEDELTGRVTYMTEKGPLEREDVELPAQSQTVINARDDIGSADFSTEVVCLEGETIAVDRRMTWTGPGASSPEGHASVGVTSPSRAWYLPEGSSRWGFETWLLIQNPNEEEAGCVITYMSEEDGPFQVTRSVPANSRASYNMAEDVGEMDASIRVESDLPVIPERATYRNDRREGHGSIGSTELAEEYFLAEGSTGWGFTTYVLVQNPQSSEIELNLTYLTAEGPYVTDPILMPGASRKTVRVNDVLPNKDFSTLVRASAPVVAERSMYWDAGSGEACHDSIGMARPHSVFYLPDGETWGGYETWTLVANPGDDDVEIEVSYMTPDGRGNVSFTDSVPAGTRSTYNMADYLGKGRAAVMVRSTEPGKKVICERAMYWNSRGAGTDTIGGYSD